jgi:hypothetical protein
VAIVTIHPLRGEAMHYFFDGVFHCKYLTLAGVVSLYGGEITNVSTTVSGTLPLSTNSNMTLEEVDLWIVDGQHVAKLTKRPLWKKILAPNNHSVLFVDFSDRFAFQRRHYAKLGLWYKLERQANMTLRLAVRSIVEGRMFNADRKAIYPNGNVAPNPFRIIHFPYAVRSDIVHAMLQELYSIQPSNALWSSTALQLHTADDRKRLEKIQHLLFDDTVLPRTLDVYHPWQVTSKKGQSELRNVVSRLVRSWNGNSINAYPTSPDNSLRVLNTSIEEAGSRMDQGRSFVDHRYVRALLQAKIVIVAQRDGWEDHYRLFEAMTCGSLVISDRMMAPPRGLIHGETIVFFDDMENLLQLVGYYMTHNKERERIARAGWLLAMTQHRSWHRMEEVLFGSLD